MVTMCTKASKFILFFTHGIYLRFYTILRMKSNLLFYTTLTCLIVEQCVFCDVCINVYISYVIYANFVFQVLQRRNLYLIYI